MEEKKAKHVNLEKKRGLFLQIGFVISLSVILMAFEWSSEKQKTDIPITTGEPEFVEIIENTFRKEEKKIEKPKPEVNITEVIELVSDDIIIEDEILNFSSEADFNSRFNIDYTFIDEPCVSDIPFAIVEDMPIFRPKKNRTRVEGDIDLYNYVASRVKYPELARDVGISGKVYVSFVVDKKGKVKNVAIARGIDSLLDAEAVRVVKTLPDFKAGKQRGIPVNVSYNVVINFKLG